MNNKLAYIFPGQGSQKLGMGKDLYVESVVVRDIMEQASRALGYDLWQIIQNDEIKLNQTHITQPALLAVSIAMWRHHQKLNNSLPVIMAGHSLGEYSALVAAGAIDFVDGIKLVAKRGEIMQDAVSPGVGAMAAIIGLEDKVIEDLCEQISNDKLMVVPVNYNSPGQIVVSGHKDAVNMAALKAKEAGARLTTVLKVSVPSHSKLMENAADKFAKILEPIKIKEPKIKVLHNCDVTAYSEPAKIKEALVKQLYSPVRWTATILKMRDIGIEEYVECGPGKVLVGLNRRILN